jgi:hypothetical protein
VPHRQQFRADSQTLLALAKLIFALALLLASVGQLHHAIGARAYGPILAF